MASHPAEQVTRIFGIAKLRLGSRQQEYNCGHPSCLSVRAISFQRYKTCPYEVSSRKILRMLLKIREFKERFRLIYYFTADSRFGLTAAPAWHGSQPYRFANMNQDSLGSWTILSSLDPPRVYATIENDQWQLNTTTRVTSELSVLVNSALILLCVANYPVQWFREQVGFFPYKFSKNYRLRMIYFLGIR